MIKHGGGALLLGVLGAIVLILLSGGLRPVALPATEPRDLPQVNLPKVPLPDVEGLKRVAQVMAATAKASMPNGASSPEEQSPPSVESTPVSTGTGQASFAIEEYTVTRISDVVVQIKGKLHNTGSSPITISRSSLKAVSSSGTSYSTDLGKEYVVAPNAFATLDISIPSATQDAIQFVATIDGVTVKTEPTAPKEN